MPTKTTASSVIQRGGAAGLVPGGSAYDRAANRPRGVRRRAGGRAASGAATEGLLPICSHCKEAGNGQRVWHRVEACVSAHTRAPGSAMAAARAMRRAQEPCAATWVHRATRNDEPSSDGRRPPQPALAGSVHSKSSTTVRTVSPMTFASCTPDPGPVSIKASRYSSRELTTGPRADDKRDCPDGGRMVEPAGAGAGMVGFWLARTPCNIAPPHARSHGVGPSSEQAAARVASRHGRSCGTVIAWYCHD